MEPRSEKKSWIFFQVIFSLFLKFHFDQGVLDHYRFMSDLHLQSCAGTVWNLFCEERCVQRSFSVDLEPRWSSPEGSGQGVETSAELKTRRRVWEWILNEQADHSNQHLEFRPIPCAKMRLEGLKLSALCCTFTIRSALVWTLVWKVGTFSPLLSVITETTNIHPTSAISSPLSLQFLIQCFLIFGVNFSAGADLPLG